MKRPLGLAIVRLGFLAAVLTAGQTTRAQAQQVDVGRAQASRKDLESALAELEKIAASTGYSGSLRKTKQAEAQMVRTRLAEGDFQVGDQIDLVVVGEPDLSKRFSVQADRSLALPNLPPISMKGILRSEASSFLTVEIGKFLRQPQVQVQASYIRLAVLGAVMRPGYYTMAADLPISEAIMAAGGPMPGGDLAKTMVRRGDREAIGRDQLRAAVAGGQSIDQLNLHGGDELIVGGSTNPPNPGGPRWLVPVQIGTAILMPFVLILLR